MHKMTSYLCDYCGAAFASEEVCREHEGTHTHDHSGWSDRELSDALAELADEAYTYQAFNMVCGLPLEDFSNLMTVAARRLRAYGETL